MEPTRKKPRLSTAQSLEGDIAELERKIEVSEVLYQEENELVSKDKGLIKLQGMRNDLFLKQAQVAALRRPRASITDLTSEIFWMVCEEVLEVKGHEFHKPYDLGRRGLKRLLRLRVACEEVRSKVDGVLSKLLGTVEIQMTPAHLRRLLTLSHIPVVREYIREIYVRGPVLIRSTDPRALSSAPPGTSALELSGQGTTKLTLALQGFVRLQKIELTNEPFADGARFTSSNNPSRTVAAILSATAVSRSKVRNLILEPYACSERVWTRGVALTSVDTAGERLKFLKKIRLCVNGKNFSWKKGDLNKFLSDMPALSELDFSCRERRLSDGLFAEFTGVRYPKLKILKLASFDTTKCCLRDFIQLNRSRLRVVEFGDMSVPHTSSSGCRWWNVLQALQSCPITMLQLRKLRQGQHRVYFQTSGPEENDEELVLKTKENMHKKIEAVISNYMLR